jgi:hypothetical protein
VVRTNLPNGFVVVIYLYSLLDKKIRNKMRWAEALTEGGKPEDSEKNP